MKHVGYFLLGVVTLPLFGALLPFLCLIVLFWGTGLLVARLIGTQREFLRGG